MTNDSTGHRARTPSDRPRPGAWRGRPFPVHPLLVAAYPVLFLYGENVGELELADLVVPLLLVVAGALALLVLGALLLRDARRAAIVVSALAAVLLFYGHVTDMLGPLGVRVGVQQVALAGFVALAAIVAFRI